MSISRLGVGAAPVDGVIEKLDIIVLDAERWTYAQNISVRTLFTRYQTVFAREFEKPRHFFRSRFF